MKLVCLLAALSVAAFVIAALSVAAFVIATLSVATVVLAAFIVTASFITIRQCSCNITEEEC